MSNIEEDKERLMKSLNYELDKIMTRSRKVETATEILNLRQPITYMFLNLLAEREQDKKRIKELEEERQIVGMPVRNKRDGKIGIVLHQWENGSIAVLENISPRVINTHDSFDTLEIITDEVKHVKTKDDSIPVQKVKDKIEENKDTAKRVAGTYQYADSRDDLEEKKRRVIELRIKAEALEELLEDK